MKRVLSLHYDVIILRVETFPVFDTPLSPPSFQIVKQWICFGWLKMLNVFDRIEILLWFKYLNGIILL